MTRHHRLRTPVVAAVAVAAGMGLALTVPASAHGGHGSPPGTSTTAPAVPAPPASPTRADQIQNIDQVKTAIKGYYGDTITTTLDPVNGTTALHTFSPTGAYVSEMAGIEKKAKHFLAKVVKHSHHGKTYKGKGHHGRPAIVLDVDDTTLNTYSYEIWSSFVYNPTTNGAFVNAAIFPAVPGMPDLVSFAEKKGYTIFFLTGRPEAQRAGTTQNLTEQGYPAIPADQLYLKDLTAPWLASCATTTPACTTVQYKSLTRAHIESLGYNLVANFGDQYSDLEGGYADKGFKLPNPMYFLP